LPHVPLPGSLLPSTRWEQPQSNTDARQLVISIPIIILWKAKIKREQKFALGAFLCLSSFMIIIAVIRASKIRGAMGVDIVWEFFWQYMEAAVAVMMGSITAFRALFAAHGRSKNRSAEERGRKNWATNTFLRMRGRKKSQETGDVEAGDEHGLPHIPSATITGLRTFIRQNNRAPGLATTKGDPLQSELRTLNEEEDDGIRLTTVTKEKHVSGLPYEFEHMVVPEYPEQGVRVQRDVVQQVEYEDPVGCHFPFPFPFFFFFFFFFFYVIFSNRVSGF
jgi:hypothetical protein